MAVNVLSLPIDIPWKRLCVSSDMNDGMLCDGRLPPKWRSSIAIFGYEPPESEQTHDDMVVSYLKVACSITGFQADPKEVGLEQRRAPSYWKGGKVTDNYEETVAKYYGCKGAILQVAVGSKYGRIILAPGQEPYFADFEPKKRELYELVTETGEVMSRSLEAANVRKGTTTTDAHEVVDSQGLSVSVSESSGVKQAQQVETSRGAQYETSTKTKNLNQQEISDIRTTDQGREMRETYSHTTQLTQMYHQLTSYHVGTNRAVFFMLPRPHIIQPKDEFGRPVYTFVNGPRELEGIQEFFLVVMRPKGSEFCVEAYLETAHIGSVPNFAPKDTRQERFHVQKLSAPVEDKDSWYDSDDDSYTNSQKRSDSFPIPAGWEIDYDENDKANHPGYKVDNVNIEWNAGYDVDVGSDHLTVNLWANGRFVDNKTGNDLFPASIEVFLTVYLRTKEKKIVDTTNRLFLTGRGLCCCPEEQDIPFPVHVSWESYLGSQQQGGTSTAGTKVLLHTASSGMTIVEANAMGAEIGQKLHQSLNAVDRYPRGRVGLAETRLVAETVARMLEKPGDQDNQPVRDIAGLDPDVSAKIAEVAPHLRRAHLLRMSMQEQMDRFGLTEDKAVHLRRATIGLEGPPPDLRRRWDPPGSLRGTEQIVPSLVGLSVEEARRKLRDVGLSTGEVSSQDSEQPRNTVLSHCPNAGKKALSGGPGVSLVVATGLSVQIPEVVCQSLSRALCMLHEAGLEVEPELIFEPSDEIPKNYVVEVTPAMRTYITPHAEVSLRVSSGPC